jgi:TolA-binding protein
LGIGEALVSVLDDKGSPTAVERVMIAPPASRIGPLADEERAEVMARSPYKAIYNQVIDRESAYEILKGRVAEQEQTEQQQKIQEQLRVEQERILRQQQKEQAQQQKEQARSAAQRNTAVDAFAKSAARAIGSSLGRQIVRGILGSLLGGRR